VNFHSLYTQLLTRVKESICYQELPGGLWCWPDYELNKITVEDYSRVGLLVFNVEKYYSGELLAKVMASGMLLGFFISVYLERFQRMDELTQVPFQIAADVNTSYYPNPKLKGLELVEILQEQLLGRGPLPVTGSKVYISFGRVVPSFPTRAQTLYRTALFLFLNSCKE